MNSVVDRRLTPSKITARLDCADFFTLRSQLDDGLLAEPDATDGSFARLLAAKWIQHDRECLAGYAREDKSRIGDAGVQNGEDER